MRDLQNTELKEEYLWKCESAEIMIMSKPIMRNG